MHSRLLGLVAGLGALTATGCGEQKIDVKGSNALIRGSVEEQLGIRVKAVTCPAEVKVQARAVFTCLVTGQDGSKGTATVKQTDGKGTLGVVAPFLHDPAQSIQTDLRTRSPRATVVCEDIIVVKAGATFTCRANLGETNATVNATQTRAKDSFTYNVKGLE
jgi:hypothetical protein